MKRRRRVADRALTRKPRATVRIPDIKVLAKISIPWHGPPKGGRSFAQTIRPEDRALNKKLGIKKGSKVFAFAGYAGDWAGKLANTCRIYFTDLSPRNIRLVRRKYKDRFAGYFTRNALFTHQTKAPRFDWSFSYEPYPTHNGQLQIALVRSLLNKRGAKLVYSKLSAQYEREAGKVEGMLKGLFEQQYGATVKAENVNVGGYKRDSKRLATNEVIVVTLETNSQARRRAIIDLKVLRGMRSLLRRNPLDPINLKTLLSMPSLKKLKIKQKELEESLKRLNKLSDNINNHSYYYRKLPSKKARSRTKLVKVV